jgi:DNA-binding response OmpR family regulator
MGRLLVVEDDPNVRECVDRALRRAGHSVESACTGREALEKLRHDKPDGVLLGRTSPLHDGWHVLSACFRSTTPVLVSLLPERQELDGDCLSRAVANLEARVRRLIDPSALSA